jgi:CheY-like chemotaxis protein
VAHDFNNVLGAILGRTQLLSHRLEIGALSTEDLVTSLAVIEQAAQDGRETGRRLRQFGQSSPKVAEPVDLRSVLKDAVEFTRPRWENEAQAAGLAIHVSLEAQPGLWVAGRASELREVFTNLLLNSIDALPHGGSILLGARLEGDLVHVRVTDDGVGMDGETSRRLFEPFFTTKGDRGTGLGLSVVYGIVQRHGGTIEVVTRPGQGTSMELTFPRTVARDAAPETEVTLDGLPALDVMVVDDEAPVREVLRDIAETFGQHVTSCASGDEALRAFRPGAFQLVLTDLGMPGMTGWDLSRRLREMDLDVTIVFVTGWGENVDGGAATQAGADLVLAKPFNIEDVARAIRLAARPRERMAA